MAHCFDAPFPQENTTYEVVMDESHRGGSWL